MTKDQEQTLARYSAILHDHIAEIFKEGGESYINPNEFEDDKNSTLFIHALATIAPGLIFNQITGSDLNALEFNHMANQLCFQFSTGD